jgi:hypothetical protein
MFERHLETGQPAASDKQHWRGVLQALQLSESQVNWLHFCPFSSLIKSIF